MILRQKVQMTEQGMLKEALEWQEHIRKLITATDDELYHKRSKVFDWLIQKVERVEELQLEIDDWRAEVQKWQRFYKESEESHLETKELLKSIVNQNKHYREALEEIARGRFPGASYKARQALEVET